MVHPLRLPVTCAGLDRNPIAYPEMTSHLDDLRQELFCLFPLLVYRAVRLYRTFPRLHRVPPLWSEAPPDRDVPDPGISPRYPWRFCKMIQHRHTCLGLDKVPPGCTDMLPAGDGLNPEISSKFSVPACRSERHQHTSPTLHKAPPGCLEISLNLDGPAQGLFPWFVRPVCRLIRHHHTCHGL